MKTKVVNKINELFDNELVILWNEYQSASNGGNMIYDNSEYHRDEFFGNLSISELLEMGRDGFDVNDDYIYCHDVHGWQSFDNLSEVVYIEDIADWLIDCNGSSSIIDIDEL